MNSKVILTFGFFILFFTQTLFVAQTVDPPAPPPPPDYEFNFDFQNFHKMNLEDEEAILKGLKEKLLLELTEIKKVNEKKYYDFLRQAQFKNMTMPFLNKRYKERHEKEKKIFELEVAAEAIATKYKRSNKKIKEQLKTKLRDQLNKLFDLKEMKRKNEVEDLEKELVELKQTLNLRLNNKIEIVNRRIFELLNEGKHLDWD